MSLTGSDPSDARYPMRLSLLGLPRCNPSTRLTKSAREMLSVPHAGNARETVINLGYGEWVVDEVSRRGHREAREGAEAEVVEVLL